MRTSTCEDGRVRLAEQMGPVLATVVRRSEVSRPDLPALTSLRFFAALYVVVFHGAQRFFGSELGRSFAGTGFVAVDLFFVLSGFVLTYRYCTDEGQLTASHRKFWVARLGRIYPVYALGIAISAPMYVQTLLRKHSIVTATKMAFPSGIATLALMQAWFYRTATNWNAPAWSLSVEAFLYLAFPFVMPRLLRSLGQGEVMRMVAVIGTLWLASLLPAFLYLLASPDGISHVDAATQGVWLNTVRFTPLFHLASFMLGIVAGWAHRRPERVGVPSWVVVSCAAVVLAILCAGKWLPYVLLHTGLLAPLFAVLVYCVAGSRGRITRILSTRGLVALGDASYALYLLHFPVLLIARGAAGHELSLIQFVGTFIGLQLVCLGVYHFVEVPARAAIRRRFA